MSEITCHIMVSGDETRIDIEKLVIWALRKQDYMFDVVKPGTELVLTFEFDFVPEHEAPVKYMDIIGDFDTEPDLSLQKEIANDPELEIVLDEHKIPSNRILFRAPNNTALFRHWIETNKIKQFTLESFVSQNQMITRISAEKIISHQIRLKKLLQLDNTTFKVLGEI